MCSPSPPPAPDYTGAAEATAEGALEAAQYQTRANRPDEYTPYGSRTWTSEDVLDQSAYDEALAAWEAGRPQAIEEIYDEDAGTITNEQAVEDRRLAIEAFGAAPEQSQYTTEQWRSDISLTPEGQALFDAENRNKLGMSELSEAGRAQVADVFGDKFELDQNRPSYEGPGTYGENRQRTMDSMLARVNEQTEQDRDDKRSQLIAQGIPPGSEAWKREMDQINENLTDARQQAEIAATDQAGREYQSALTGANQQYGAQTDERSRMVQELLMNRQTPLNEFNAFRSGSQVNMPQFGAYGQQGQTSGPDYVGAQGAQSAYDIAGYNADVASTNQNRGTAAALAAAYMMSDRRLKHSIVKRGVHSKGMGIYEFSYVGETERYIGVMAQEVLPIIPEAVIEINGYMAVNYGAL